LTREGSLPRHLKSILEEQGIMHERKILLDKSGDRPITDAGYANWFRGLEVIYEPPQVSPTGKQFMPASEAGATKGKVAEAAKLWKEKGIDSPYFKKWFGKSKVVDDDGEPLVVYRGLDKTDQTDLSKGREAKDNLDGVHFSDDISYAQTYETEGGQTYPVYLQIKKPLDLRNIKSGNDLIGRFEKSKIPLSLKVNPFQWSQDAKSNVTAPLKYHLDRTIKNVEDIGGFVEDNFNPNMDLTDNLGRFVKDYVDGIIFNEHGGESVSYIAFSPEQIKSATGNRGTFDAGEGNINYMPSDPKAPKRQPANRIQPQAPAMPGNRFMAPAIATGGKISERFR